MLVLVETNFLVSFVNFLLQIQKNVNKFYILLIVSCQQYAMQIMWCPIQIKFQFNKYHKSCRNNFIFRFLRKNTTLEDQHFSEANNAARLVHHFTELPVEELCVSESCGLHGQRCMHADNEVQQLPQTVLSSLMTSSLSHIEFVCTGKQSQREGNHLLTSQFG